MPDREYEVMVKVIVTVPEDEAVEAEPMLGNPRFWEPMYLGEDYPCEVAHVELGDWVPA